MTTRDRILAAAIAELESRGLDGVSLRTIGQKAEITPMAVYRHFTDKADLMQALGEYALGQWQMRVAAQVMTHGATLRVGFAGLTTAFVDFAFDEPALFDAAFVLKTRAERIYPDDFEAGRSPVIGGFAKVLAVGQAEGTVRSGVPLELAMGVWGVLHGLISLHRSGRFNLTRPEFTALCLRSAARMCMTGDAI